MSTEDETGGGSGGGTAEIPDDGEIRRDGEAVCMSCGTAVDPRRTRCPECGAPQRRRRFVLGRRPAGPFLAIGLVALLFLVALAVAMFRDQKAGPSRAYSQLNGYGRAGDCEKVIGLLSSEGEAAYPDKSVMCGDVKSFDWSGAAVSTINLEDSEHATICLTRPRGVGLAVRKESGRWLFDSATPTLRDACRQEVTAVG